MIRDQLSQQAHANGPLTSTYVEALPTLIERNVHAMRLLWLGSHDSLGLTREQVNSVIVIRRHGLDQLATTARALVCGRSDGLVGDGVIGLR